MHKVYLGIGGNLGNKHNNFRKVVLFIQNNLGNVLQTSSIYETPPWGFQNENNFWNQVILIETQLSPKETLSEIHKIEKSFGRTRGKVRYSSREMDIDILYYDELSLETEDLIIPHPHIQQRKFVLIPLVEIASDFKHPLLRFTSLELLKSCEDHSIIKKVIQ